MTFVHRHLDIPASTPPNELPLDALDDLLERGGFDDWGPLVAAIRHDPKGPLAERVLGLCRAHPMYGTSALWQDWIRRLRNPDHDRRRPSLASLRRGRGFTQERVAAALGISQSDVSKIERQRDMRISTLRRYLAALGAELDVVATFDDETVHLQSE